jgi:dihydrofolate reductase
MRKLILRMTLTLDGVAAPEAKDVFDFSDDGVWRDHFQLLEGVDGVLLGAGMHREYFSHWHGALTDPNEQRYAEYVKRTPHFVLSRTQKGVEWPNASVLPGGVDGIAALKQQPGGALVMWGGPTAAAAAIEAGAVDEYHLVTHPVIAGRGTKLFEVAQVRRLKHLDTSTLPSGIVILKYAAA